MFETPEIEFTTFYFYVGQRNHVLYTLDENKYCKIIIYNI
jgi:hypothetical protein